MRLADADDDPQRVRARELAERFRRGPRNGLGELHVARAESRVATGHVADVRQLREHEEIEAPDRHGRLREGEYGSNTDAERGYADDGQGHEPRPPVLRRGGADRQRANGHKNDGATVLSESAVSDDGRKQTLGPAV
jgi:hypothetical protein